jgi:hypothetical protein
VLDLGVMLGKGATVAFVALVVGCGSADAFRGVRGTGGADSGPSAGATGAGGSGEGIVLCASDKTCTPLGKLCDTTAGRCVDCLGNADCTGGTCRGGVCQARVACNNSLDCAGAPNGRAICDGVSGDCVQCVSSADCDRGQACTANLCTGTGTGGSGGTAGAGGRPVTGGSFGVGGFFGLGGFYPGGAPSTGGISGDGGFGPGGTGGLGGDGGSGTAGGGPGVPCSRTADCASKVCAGGVCQPPTCEDGTVNGDEASADCGGPCPVCRVGGSCTAGASCASGTCTPGTGGASGRCAAASTCSNSLQDGTETDVDCGGLACAKCAAGKRCRTPGDCNTRICAAGVCGTCNPDMCLSSAASVYPPCCNSTGACGSLGLLVICI